MELAVLSLAVLLSIVPAAASQETDVQELLRLEQVWNAAHQTGDADALGRLWADELVVSVPSMRVMNKADAIGMLEGARMKFQKYESSDIRVRVYGDAAVVTGRVWRTRVANGANTDDDWRFTKTYIRRGAAWQVVAFHASPAR